MLGALFTCAVHWNFIVVKVCQSTPEDMIIKCCKVLSAFNTNTHLYNIIAFYCWRELDIMAFSEAGQYNLFTLICTHCTPKCQNITMHSRKNTSMHTTQNISNYSIPQQSVQRVAITGRDGTHYCWWREQVQSH